MMRSLKAVAEPLLQGSRLLQNFRKKTCE